MLPSMATSQRCWPRPARRSGASRKSSARLNPPHIRLSAPLRLAPLATETLAGIAAPVGVLRVQRHADARCHDAQYPLLPRLVHVIHAVPGGDQPWQPRVASQLPEECYLTVLDDANALLLDEATATGGALHLACRSVSATDDDNPSAELTFICSPDLHLQTLIAVQARADGSGCASSRPTRRQ